MFNEEYGKLSSFVGGFENLPAVRQDAKNLIKGCNELGIEPDNVHI